MQHDEGGHLGLQLHLMSVIRVPGSFLGRDVRFEERLKNAAVWSLLAFDVSGSDKPRMVTTSQCHSVPPSQL